MDEHDPTAAQEALNTRAEGGRQPSASPGAGFWAVPVIVLFALYFAVLLAPATALPAAAVSEYPVWAARDLFRHLVLANLILAGTWFGPLPRRRASESPAVGRESVSDQSAAATELAVYRATFWGGMFSVWVVLLTAVQIGLGHYQASPGAFWRYLTAAGGLPALLYIAVAVARIVSGTLARKRSERAAE